MEENKILLFTYGTLQRGISNHYKVGIDKQRFVGVGETLEFGCIHVHDEYVAMATFNTKHCPI